MTDRELMQQALEALQAYGAHTPNCDHLMLLLSLPPQRKPCSCGLVATMQALRDRLAQPEQEPVALEDVYLTIIQWDIGGGKRSRRELARRIVAKYTTAPQRKPDHIVDVTKMVPFKDLAAELFVVAQISPADDGFSDTMNRIEAWLRNHFSTPPQRKPLPPQSPCEMTQAEGKMFKLGWLECEAAHGIKGEA